MRVNCIVRPLIVFILIGYSLLLFGQQKVDKTGQLLKQAKSFRLKGDFDRNRQLVLEARKLVDSTNNPAQQAEVFGELSRINLYEKAFEMAKSYADSAMRIGQSSKDRKSLIFGHMALATYYNYLEIRDLAVEHAQRSLDLLQDSEAILKPRLYYILYGTYSSWNNAPLTNKYAQLTVEEALKVDDYDLLSNGYAAQSVGMELNYRETKNRAYLDSMLMYLYQAENLFSRFPDEVSKHTYAIANLNIANHYFQYHSLQNRAIQDSIIKYAMQAKRAVEHQDVNYQIRGNVNGLMAELAKQTGNYDQAETLLLDAYQQTNKAMSPSSYSLMQIANGLSQLYERKGQYEKALYYIKQKEAQNNKIFDQNQVVQAQQLEAKYENKAMRAEMEAVKEREQNRKIQNLLFLGITLLALASLFLLYYSFKNKTRLYAEQRLRLQKEKEEVVAVVQMKEKEKRFLLIEKAETERNTQMQMRLKQEEQARLKAEQELLLVQKEQMQREALADALHIERKNQLLSDIKKRFDEQNGLEDQGTFDKILRDELRNEGILDKSAKEFMDIHPGFFLKLKELSAGKMTALDLKYCAYIHLKLSTKEISSIFHIEPKSVRMSKYRIKQKLDLPKDQDLDIFLQELS